MVEVVFGGVELNFVLEACIGAFGVDDQGGEPDLGADEAFGAEDGGGPGALGGFGYVQPCPMEEIGVRREKIFAGPTIARNVTFGETDDGGVLSAGIGDRLLREDDGFLARGGVRKVGEGDSD